MITTDLTPAVEKKLWITLLGSYPPLGLTQPHPHWSLYFTKIITNALTSAITYLPLHLTQPHSHSSPSLTKMITKALTSVIEKIKWIISFFTSESRSDRTTYSLLSIFHNNYYQCINFSQWKNVDRDYLSLFIAAPWFYTPTSSVISILYRNNHQCIKVGHENNEWYFHF